MATQTHKRKGSADSTEMAAKKHANSTSLMQVSKGDDLRKDALIMYSPDIRWNEFLEPAPLSIALLGQLLLISSKRDFSLERSPPRGGFKLVKYPSSFRASLVQVSNEGWKAFNEAHTSMEQIRLHTQNVPGHLKTAVNTILKGNETEMAYMLKSPLQSIQYIADKCLQLATATEGKFLVVMELIGELIEASTNARGQKEKDMESILFALKIAKESKLQAEAQHKLAEDHLRKVEQDVARAHKDYQKTIKRSDSPMYQLTSFVRHVVHDVSAIFVPRLQYPSNETRESDNHENNDQSKKEEDERNNILIHANDLHSLVNSLLNVVNNDKCDCSAEQETINQTMVKAEHMKRVIDESDDSALKTSAIKICDGILRIGKKFVESTESIANEFPNVCKEAKQVLNELLKSCKTLHAMASTQHGIQLRTTPRMSRATSSNTGMDEVNFKLNMQCEFLKYQHSRYDQASQRLSDSSQKIADVMMEISKYDLEYIDLNQIRDVLMKGMMALAGVREEWGKMVRFFQSISNIIRCTLNTSLKTFCDTIQGANEVRESQRSLTFSDCLVDQIYDSTSEAAKIAHVVNNVAGLYVDISSKHLMDRVASLGKLVALDPEKDSHTINEMMKELTDSCETTQRAIRDVAERKHSEFKDTVDERIKQLKDERRSTLASVSPATDAENRQIAKDAMEKAKHEREMEQYS